MTIEERNILRQAQRQEDFEKLTPQEKETYELTHPEQYCTHAPELWKEKQGKVVKLLKECVCGKQVILDYSHRPYQKGDRDKQIAETNSRSHESLKP